MADQNDQPFIVSIDDEKPILTLVEAILGSSYNLQTYLGSELALSAFEEGLSPDLIICDIDMPGLDGFGLHETIRSMSHLRSVPFIFLTGLDDRQTFRKGMQSGADDYLTKPFSPDELKEAVASRLARTGNLRALEVQSFQIFSMGGVGVMARGEYLTYEAKKVVEILLYLLARKSPVFLRHVTPELWHEQVGENNLHVLINRARKTYEGLVEFPVDGDELRVNVLENYDWDAENFETAAELAAKTKDYADCERAIRLYKGSFLPGYESPWADNQRSYYDSQYLQMLELSIETAPNDAAKKSAEARLQSFLGVDEL